MKARWVVPLICYGALLGVVALVAGSTLLPSLSTYAFASLYLFVPAVLFCLALLLCVTDTNVPLKLLFPVVALVGLPLGSLLYESQGGLVTDTGRFSADLGLALVVGFAPAALGTLVGLIVWGVKRRLRKQKAKAVAARGGAGRGKATVNGSGSTRRGTGAGANGGAGVGRGPKLRVNPGARTGTGAGAGAGARTGAGAGRSNTSRRTR